MASSNPCFLLRIATCLLGALLVTASAFAQATGSINGRVSNDENGTFLNNARVMVEDSGQTAFTNEFGEYRLADVPARAVRLKVFFTGFPEQVASVNVAAGQSVQMDFALARSEARREGDKIIMDPVVVASQREMEARAIAINEQRFAPNIMNVVSTDEFGDLGNSSVGDFIKLMPGVIVDNEFVSVRGLPPHTVPLTVDGNRLATNFAAEQNQRAAALDSAALNNVARIEVTKSPTPDKPADSLGGSVNLVSKRAFDRTKPLFMYHLYATGSPEFLSLSEYAGPSPQTSTRRIRPGVDFSYIVPINARFGFTFTGLAFDQLTTDYLRRPFWVPNGVSRAGGTAENPYMAQFAIQNQVTYRKRASFGTTLDWKITPRDVLSVGLQYTYMKTDFNTNSNNMDISGTTAAAVPVAYGPTFTQGATNAGRIQYAGSTRRVPITTVMTRASYQHDGPEWQFEAGGFFSKSSSKLRDIDYGHFRNTQLRLNSATIRFDGIDWDNPGTISVRNSAGQSVGPFELGNYSLQTAFSQPKNEIEWIYGGKAHARRTFDIRVPVTVKIGIDWREQVRDLRSPFPRWDFVGPDGVANTADDVASRYDIMNTEYFDGGGGDHAGIRTAQWPSQYKIYQLFQEHPEYFRLNETATIQNTTNVSRNFVETISAAYVRFDTQLVENRLRLVGGVRFERTNDYGEGQLNDIRATFQKDANGNLLRNANGALIQISSDPVVRARAQFTDRGAKAEKSYDDFFPSLNATFNLRDNLLLRAAYARTFGRPNFGFIVPAVAIANPDSAPANRTITVNDPGLLPWTSHNLDLSLEYYTQQGGVFSAGVFRKELSDFFGQTRTPATLERLAEFGLEDDFLDYDIVRTTNVGDAELNGYEINFRQELRFLPAWARGVQVFANMTNLRVKGSSTADFDSFVPRSYNWGASLNRKRYTISLNWHARGRQRNEMVVGALTPPETFLYTAPQLTLDLNFEVRLSSRLSLYGVMRNITDVERTEESYAPQTPAYARLRTLGDRPASMIFGIKGQF